MLLRTLETISLSLSLFLSYHAAVAVLNTDQQPSKTRSLSIEWVGLGPLRRTNRRHGGSGSSWLLMDCSATSVRSLVRIISFSSRDRLYGSVERINIDYMVSIIWVERINSCRMSSFAANRLTRAFSLTLDSQQLLGFRPLHHTQL